jgi:PAS domain S-box-containing protein
MTDFTPPESNGISAGELHLRLLEQFAPPSIVVTEEHTLVHVSEHGGRFLHVAGGEPSRDVMKLIHPSLRGDLRTALRLATERRAPAEVRGARLPGAYGDEAIRIVVRPVLRDGVPPRGYFLVIFENERRGAQAAGFVERLGSDTRQAAAPALPAVNEDGNDERLRLVIDSAIDYAIFTMTPEGRIDYWNAGAQRMFGYESSEILGRHAAILFTPEDRAAGVPEEELTRAARTGRADDERWHQRRNGERFFVSGVTTRLGDAATLGFAKIARDLTDQQQAETALRTMRDELEDRVRQRTAQLEAELSQHAAARDDVTELLHRVVTAQEDERARIARDLHDHLGQQLTGLRMALEQHAGRCTQPDAHDIQRAIALTREIDTELDFLAWELRPAVLDDLGIVAALPRFLNEWSAHYGIASHFAAAGDPGGMLSREAELTIYRVAQEALNNVVKHAHASRVDVLLERRDRTVVLVIEDDGVGFQPDAAATAARGIGLAGMRERAALVGGALQVESQPGGTTIYLRCPVSAENGGAR